MVTTLKWVITSIGISGIFMAVGFIVESAHQDRLGYALGSADNLVGLSIQAGDFFLTALLLILNSIAEHPFIIAGATVGLGLLALGAPAALRRLPEQYRSLPRRLTGWPRLTLLFLLLLIEIVVLDVPVLNLHGMLVHGLAPPENSERQWLTWPLTNAVWQEEVCSRVKEDYYPRMNELSVKCEPRSAAFYEHRKRDRFAVNLLSTFVLLTLVVRTTAGQKAQTASGGAGASWQSAVGPGLILLLALLDCILLPYCYGKTLRSTLASEAVLSRAPAGSDAVHGFILYQKADAYVLFHKLEKHIWVLPRQEVDLVRIEDERDVIAFMLNKKLEDLAESPPAP